MTMRSHTISPSAQPPRLRPGQDGRHTTFCRICEAFCGLRVDVADGRMTRIRPDPDNLASQGHLCVKGVAALAVAYDPDRVVTPLKRVGGPGDFAPVSWEEAMAHIAERLATILRRDGPDAIANYIGNPAAYSTGGLLGIRPFLAHFGVWKLFASTTLDLSSRMLASYILYGSTFRLAIPDLPRCDFLLMFGANPLVSHGSILTAPRIREDLAAIAARGRVVAVDPRRTETAARFEHVSIRPDTDVWMLAAMVNVILDHRPERHAAVEGMQGWTEFRAAIGSLPSKGARIVRVRKAYRPVAGPCRYRHGARSCRACGRAAPAWPAAVHPRRFCRGDPGADHGAACRVRLRARQDGESHLYAVDRSRYRRGG